MSELIPDRGNGLQDVDVIVHLLHTAPRLFKWIVYMAPYDVFVL